MKKYSIAINSITFIISLIIGIMLVNVAMRPSTLESFIQYDKSLRIINIGEITETYTPDSFVFKYSFGGRTELANIEITENTKFYTSKLITKDGIVHGREVTDAKKSDVSIGKKVVVDWIFQEGKSYTAINVTFVDSGLTTLLY